MVAMKTNDALTAERLRALLHYDRESGLFTWRVAVGRWGRIKAGTITGSPDASGYLRIQVDGRLYYAARLAVLHVTGRWPSGDVDHRNTFQANNRWSNLRDVPHSVNTENRRRPSASKASGLPLGVSVDSRDGAFRADIMVAGRAKSLGRFDSADSAHAAYVDAKRRLHTGCTL